MASSSGLKGSLGGPNGTWVLKVMYQVYQSPCGLSHLDHEANLIARL